MRLLEHPDRSVTCAVSRSGLFDTEISEFTDDLLKFDFRCMRQVKSTENQMNVLGDDRL